MISIPLSVLPNQSLSIRLDGVRHDLILRCLEDMMAVDVVRGGEPIVRGMRACAGTPLLPYPYQYAGNLIFVTAGGKAPWYEEFGTTQSLMYMTQAEIEALS